MADNAALVERRSGGAAAVSSSRRQRRPENRRGLAYVSVPMIVGPYYLGLATKRPAGWFETEFRRWPFESWGPIVRQTFVILNQVNRARKAAGLELIPTSCVPLKRRIYRPLDVPVAANH